MKVDVHSKPGVDGSIIGPAGETREGTDLESSGGRGDRDRWSIVQPDEVGYKQREGRNISKQNLNE